MLTAIFPFSNVIFRDGKVERVGPAEQTVQRRRRDGMQTIFIGTKFTNTSGASGEPCRVFGPLYFERWASSILPTWMDMIHIPLYPDPLRCVQPVGLERLLVLVTAFTVGHSLTLALATLDVVNI